MMDESNANQKILNLFSRHSEHIESYIRNATAVSVGIIDLKGKAIFLNQGFKDIIGPDFSFSTNLMPCFINPAFDFFIRHHNSDTGKGMSTEVVEHIFEPFYTTLRARGGTGLGMYICHNIVVSRLNGTIECSSTQGEGSKFLITFPIPEGDSHEAD